jgi:cytochrome P450
MAVPAPLMPDVDFLLDYVPDFHERIAELRKHGPIVPIMGFGKPGWALLDYEHVDFAFRDKTAFDVTRYNVEVAEPFMGRALLAMKDEEHKLNRGMMNPSFLPGKARSYVEGIIEPTCHELLDRIEGMEEVDIKEAFCKPFPFTVITKLLGIPVTEEARLIQLAGDMLSYMFDEDLSRRAHKDFGAFIIPLLEERRRNPGDDLISQMLQIEVDGVRLEEEPIMAFLRSLYPAGGHSTSLNTGSAVFAVLANPAARAMVLKGEKERMAVVNEALRWEPALGIIPRLMIDDIELGGVKISREDTTYLTVTSANNDPKVFPNPREFDPTRKNLANLITFGRHEHLCLGRHLAQREMEVALRVLLERFPKMELVPDKEVRFSSTLFRTCEELWVRPYGN